MRLECTSCGASIPADDVNLDRMVAKCRRCDQVFSFGARLGHGAPPRRRPVLPSGLRVEAGEPPLPESPTYRSQGRMRERGPLVITRRWFRATHVFMLFFCLFWNGFLVVWYTTGLASGAPLMMLLFPLLHVAIGLGLTYWTLAGFLNRTVIRVADGVLEVRHRPLPWRGHVSVPTAALRQLYLRRVTHRSENSVSHTWEVRAETEDLASLEILSRLPSREDAEYIEWAIEEHLGIVDDPSRGDA